MYFSTLLAGVLAVTGVSAHPGHDYHKEMAEREAVLLHTRRDLSHCAAKLKERGVESRAVKRRTNLASQLMEEGKLKSGSVDKPSAGDNY